MTYSYLFIVWNNNVRWVGRVRKIDFVLDHKMFFIYIDR